MQYFSIKENYPRMIKGVTQNNFYLTIHLGECKIEQTEFVVVQMFN